MAIGLGVLGLAPPVFWAMTPRELDAVLRGKFGTSSGGGAPSSSDLAGLMQRFPDKDDFS